VGFLVAARCCDAETEHSGGGAGLGGRAAGLCARRAIDDLSALKSEHGQPESDITLSGNAAFLTQYAKRGFTLSAERPAVQAEFDLFYKKIYYAGIWASNVNFAINGAI
jgi:uncharacterized protein (TIGR02001 family)